MSGHPYSPYNTQNTPPQQYPPQAQPQNPYGQQTGYYSYAPPPQALGPQYSPQYNYLGPTPMNPMQQQQQRPGPPNQAPNVNAQALPSPGFGSMSRPEPWQGQRQHSQSPPVASPGAYNNPGTLPPPRSNSLGTPPYGYNERTMNMGSPGFGTLQAASGQYIPQDSRSPPSGPQPSPNQQGSQDAYTPVQMQPSQSQPVTQSTASEEYTPVDYGAPPPKIAPQVDLYEFYDQLVDRGTGLPNEVFCRMADALFFHLDKNCPNASVRGSGVIEPEKLYWLEMQFESGRDSGVTRSIMNQLDKFYTDASIPFQRGANGAPVLDRKGFIHKCVFDLKARPAVAYGRWNKLIKIFKLVDPKTKELFPENIPYAAFPSHGESSLSDLWSNYETRVTMEYWMGGARSEPTPNNSAQATSYTWSGGAGNTNGGQSSAASSGNGSGGYQSGGGNGSGTDTGGQDSSGNGYGFGGGDTGQNNGQAGQDGNTVDSGSGGESQADQSTNQQQSNSTYEFLGVSVPLPTDAQASQFIQTIEPDKKKAALYKQGAKMFTQFVGSAFGGGGGGGGN